MGHEQPAGTTLFHAMHPVTSRSLQNLTHERILMLMDHLLHRRPAAQYFLESISANTHRVARYLDEIQAHCSLALNQLRCSDNASFPDSCHFHLGLAFANDQ